MAVWLGLCLLAMMIMVGGAVVVVVSRDRLLRAMARRRDHRRNVRALKHQRGIPIERLGADLRRLRTLIQHSDHHSATQQEALRRAYDSALTDTCRMLAIEHELDRPTAGLERDIERFRIEANLQSRGIVLTPPAPTRQE